MNFNSCSFVQIFFFLTCKFHMPGLFIMPYFGHGKCSVWGFSVLKLTLFRMKRRQKGPPTSFSSVTSSNLGIRPQNFLTFSFNHFAALVQHFKFSTNASLKLLNLNVMPVSNYWTWTKTTPQKKRFSWSNPYKIEVMLTSLIEILELPNFGHMTTITL